MEGSTSQLNFNFTRLSKALAGVLCLGYVVQLVVPTARDYLTLVPGRCVGSLRKLTRLVPDHTYTWTPGRRVRCRTIPCVWNVFTAGLVDTDIFRVNCCLLFGCTCTGSTTLYSPTG